MVTNRKPTGRATSVGVGLAWAGTASLLATLAGAAVVAVLVSSEHLKQSHMGYGIMTVLILASWLGATVARVKIKRRKLVMCLAAEGIFFGTLMVITALFFGAQYSGVGETALLILCGSMLAVMGSKGPKPGGKIGKVRKRNW